MNLQTCFIEPLDVLFLRGNKLFGDPGSHGESLVPPWPSVAAGALRSRLLAEQRVDLSAFAQGRVQHPTLGTPSAPGSFAITSFQLALRHEDKRIEALHALPADLAVSDDPSGQQSVSRIRPVRVATSLQSSSPLPLLPVMAEQQRGKPANGYWLRESGWRKYLAGAVPGHDDLIHARQLWAIDTRVLVSGWTRKPAVPPTASCSACRPLRCRAGTPPAQQALTLASSPRSAVRTYPPTACSGSAETVGLRPCTQSAMHRSRLILPTCSKPADAGSF